MVKVSDYIISFVAGLGVRHVFILAGGQAMHMIDSLKRNPDISHVSALHEQAAAMMAEAYSRTTENYGVAIFTTGPGGTNAITGVASAWLDSTPCLFLSGQFRTDCLIGDQGIRQTCLQGTNPVEIVRSITKYAVLVTDPLMIRYHLEKAVYLSKSGRPGPVWLDIPLDVQGASVDISMLRGFDPSEIEISTHDVSVKDQANNCIRLLAQAKRPVILAGHGVRISHAIDVFLRLGDKLGIPILTSINGMDLIHEEHPLYFGRPNYWGQRYSNFIIQNSDVLLCIGAGLHLETTGFNFRAFARKAKKIIVDIDPSELNKRFVAADIPINADARVFMRALLDEISGFNNPNLQEWLDVCRKWRAEYPVIQPDFLEKRDIVDPFVFVDVLSDEASAEDVVIPGSAGTHFTTAVQAFKVKKGQRVFSEIGIGAMGHSLPSSIAASLARDGHRTICVTGDGGIQLNIQELQTVVNYKLPVKIFVMNNGGYMSIKNTQKGYFKGNFIGCDTSSGLGLPDMVSIARAYGINAMRINNHGELRSKIREALDSVGPVLCDVHLDPDAVLKPKVTSRLLPDGRMVSAPLEDAWPFLSREELKDHLFISPWED